jgi:hypothetical protein
MKKNLLLTALLLSLGTFIKAQIVVDALDFSTNPAKYNGKTIVIKGVNAKVPTLNTNIISNQSGNLSNNNPGKNNAPTIRCTAPRNWQVLQVTLPNDYEGCFIMFSKMSNILPIDKDVRIDLTFKVETHSMHKVTKIKVVK